MDGPFPKLCPAVALSHQDGRHSAVALLLKAALIQVSDYRLLGATGCSENFFRTRVRICIFFQNLTLGYMTKTLNQINFFFLYQNQNIFLEKN